MRFTGYVAVIVATGVVVSLPTSALAAGGPTIASAPTPVYGQQEFGNTAGDGSPPTCIYCEGSSWWLLPVTVGDQVSVNFAGQPSDGADFDLSVYPVGTTDFNVASTERYVQVANLGAGGTGTAYGHVAFTSPANGVMPLDVGSVASSGIYDFTAYVTHKLVLSIAHFSNHRLHRTAFTITYRNPDGKPVSDRGMHGSVQVLKHHRWVQLLAGPAGTRFTLRWTARMRGHKWFIREVITGGGYQTATVTTNLIAV